MFKKIISFGVVAVMLLTVFGLAGCPANIDRKHKGLSIGFNFTGPRYSQIMHAVKSDKIEFDIDNVTLDFYCGWFGEYTNWQSYESPEQICVAFYIVAYDTLWIADPRDDYQNIENHYLIAEVSANEFWSEVFWASQTKRKGKRFSHGGESIMISKEAFGQQEGALKLYAQIVSFSKEDELYHFDSGFSMWYTLRIQYKHIDSSTVQLSKI